MRHLLHRQKMDGSLARISPLVFCFAMKGQCRGGWGGEFLASPPSPTKRKSSLFHVMVQRITCLGRLLVFPHQTLSFFVDCVFMTNQKWTGMNNLVKWTKSDVSTSCQKRFRASSTTGDLASLQETRSIADARTGKHTQYDRCLSKRWFA